MNAEKFNKWLIKNGACIDGLNFANGKTMKEVWDSLERTDWMFWLIGKRNLMSEKQDLKIQIFCGERVLPIFEKQCPDDKRPRLCIEAKKTLLKKNNKKNRTACDSARDSAWASAYGFAWASAWVSARDSAWVSARDSAYDSAYDSAWASAQKNICDYVRTIIKLK
jgi:hypothetical protein